MPVFVRMTPSSVTTTGGSATISADGIVSLTSASAWIMNDIFTSDYDLYRVMVWGSNDVGKRTPNLDLTSGGTRATSGSVDYNIQYFFTNSSNTVYAGRNIGLAEEVVRVSWVSATDQNQWVMDIANPAKATTTVLRTSCLTFETADNIEQIDYVGTHLDTGSYDGLYIEAWNSGEPFTGKIQILGRSN